MARVSGGNDVVVKHYPRSRPDTHIHPHPYPDAYTHTYVTVWIETLEADDHGDDMASEGDDAPVVRYTGANPVWVSE